MGRFKKNLISNGVIGNNRGVALIVTIMAISIIVALSIRFNRKMRDHLTSAGNVDHGLKALYIAKSGVHWALALLAKDERRADMLSDDWSSTSEVLKQLSANSSTFFSAGEFDLKIEDLSGKIQINQLVDIEELSKVFHKLLSLDDFELDSEQVQEIVDSTKDWIDKAGEDDDLTRASGAEDDYYMSLEKPYHCKNGPLDSVEELMLIKGMTRALLLGTGNKDKDKATIGQYLTVFGDGKININTADPKILESLHEEMTAGMAEEMASYRKDADESILENTNWYHDNGTGVPEDIKIPDKIITTKSNYFKIISTGRYGDTSQKESKAFVERTVSAVFKRDPDTEKQKTQFQVLAWKIE